jgi:long-chain fatty acid transport protein
MDNLVNMSAKWIGANARNASLEGGDMVNYNPAGLAMTEDGFYISLNNQSLFRKPQHSFDLVDTIQSYEQDGPDYFLPSVYFAYKHNNWAVSSGIYVTGGGASVDYPEGSVNTNLMGYEILTQYILSGAGYSSISSQSLKASSYYLAIPLNFAYQVTEQLALSLGGRYIIANNHTEAGITLSNLAAGLTDYPISIEYDNNASGFGAIIGIDYTVSDKLNFSMHYESKVNLEFEVKNNKGTMNLYEDGTKSNRDLPAVLYTGVSYKINDKLTAALDFNYYFQTRADWGTITDSRDDSENEASTVAGNCYAPALGFYYQLTPKLQLTAGFKYLHFDYSDQELYYTQLGLYEAVKYDNLNTGIGTAYDISPKIQFTLGLGRTFWKDKTINSITAGDMPVNISNKAYVVALGLDIKL